MDSDWTKGQCPSCKSLWAPEGVSILIGIYRGSGQKGAGITLHAYQCPRCGAQFLPDSHERLLPGYR